MRVTVDPESLAAVAFGATYGPAFYRELTAALRSALRGDRAPLLRLVAEATGGGTDAGNPRDYSEGLDAAVACHDYPQVYDMTASPREREREYDRALGRGRGSGRTPTRRSRCASTPAPTGRCSTGAPAGRWRRRRTRPGRSVRPAAPIPTYPSWSSAASSTRSRPRPRARWSPTSSRTPPRSWWPTASTSPPSATRTAARARWSGPSCATRSAPDREPARLRRRVGPVRATGAFPQRVAEASAPPGPRAATVADVLDRWWNNYSGHGVGLRGGTFTYTGDAITRFRLDRVRLVDGLAVSGRVVWDRYGERVDVDLVLRGVRDGRLSGHWDTRAVGATAVLAGQLDGHPTSRRFPLPDPGARTLSRGSTRQNGAMPDYGQDLQFGTFLTPDAAAPDRVVELALLTEAAGLDLATSRTIPTRRGSSTPGR